MEIFFQTDFSSTELLIKDARAFFLTGVVAKAKVVRSWNEISKR